MNPAFVYILRSTSSNRYYVGCSIDPKRRVEEHNSGENLSTHRRGPWELMYLKEFGCLSDARQYEQELKRKKSSKYIKWLIESV